MAWAEGVDSQGASRGLGENCFLGTGKRASRHMGTSRQNLGNPRYVSRRSPKCQASDACHWGERLPQQGMKVTFPNRVCLTSDFPRLRASICHGGVCICTVLFTFPVPLLVPP